jgi:nucleoside triphosphatase
MPDKKRQKYLRGIEVVGGVIVENSKGKILLTRAQKWHNKWSMPGGHLEPGESIIKGSIREGSEETGLRLKPIEIVSWGEVINSKDFHRPAHFIFFDVYCKILGGKLRLQKAELNKFLWVEPGAALKFKLAEGYDKTIKDFIKYKKSKGYL